MAGVKFTSYVEGHVEEAMKQTRADSLAYVAKALEAMLEAVEAELEHVRMDDEKEIRHVIGLIGELEARIDALEKHKGGQK